MRHRRAPPCPRHRAPSLRAIRAPVSASSRIYHSLNIGFANFLLLDYSTSLAPPRYTTPIIAACVPDPAQYRPPLLAYTIDTLATCPHPSTHLFPRPCMAPKIFLTQPRLCSSPSPCAWMHAGVMRSHACGSTPAHRAHVRPVSLPARIA